MGLAPMGGWPEVCSVGAPPWMVGGLLPAASACARAVAPASASSTVAA